MSPMLLLLGWLVSAVPAAIAPHSDLFPPGREAQALYEKALCCLQRNTFDYRQQALRDLEEAVRLQPENTTFALALGQARFEAAAALVPDQAPADETASRGFTAADEERLAAWTLLAERLVLLPGPHAGVWAGPAGPRGRFASPAVPGSGPARNEQAHGTIWRYPDLGIRMEIFGRQLALGPDFPDSRAKDAASLPSSVLGGVYTEALAALGGAAR